MDTKPGNSLDALKFWEGLLDTYPESILHWKPFEDRWSIGQVYTHLQEETTYYLEQAIHCATHSLNANEVMNARGRSIFEAGALPHERIQGPANHWDTPALISKADVKEMLEKLRILWQQALKKATTGGGDGKSAHPGLGYFSAAEWLVFAGMHMRHHEHLLVSDYLVHFQT